MRRQVAIGIAATIGAIAAIATPSFSAPSNLNRAADFVQPMRVVQVDLDYVYDPDPAQQAHNLDKLVARIDGMKINAVFLQAFADPKGTGLASELYFPNRYLPVRADLFAEAATRLRDDAHVKVFGWLPVLSFDFGDKLPAVLAWNPDNGQVEQNPKAYHRLSPFDAEARADILGVYADMAKAAPIDGLLFHDDALLSDYEDASPAALEAYKAAGLPASIREIRADAADMKRWTEFKTSVLIEFTQELADKAREYRSPLLTARNIYAPVALEPKSEEWFAQDYSRFLDTYNYTAVMAMPQMENIADADADDWMKKLVVAASEHKNGLKRTIFELQAVDWRKQSMGQDRAIPTETLVSEMRFLTEQGAVNLGYYPDDFATNTPDADTLRKDFSLQTISYPL